MNYNDLNYENYTLLKNSCLFDEKWYMDTYFNNDENIDSIFHYLMKGVELGYNPNPLFDTSFYLTKHKDVAYHNMNPLIHYVKYGKKEGRAFSPEFEIVNLSLEEELFYNYENNSPNLIESVKKIIELNLFDNDYYFNNYEEVRQANVNPLIHYIKIGASENKNPSSKFNTKFYLDNYPEVKNNNINPLVHYAIQVYNKNNSYLTNETEKFNSLSDENKIHYLTKEIRKLNNKFEQQTKKYDDILKSNNELLSYIFINKNIKADGILRYIQLQTLEMLKFIVKICEKNNITYWLDYGSLLGAIRHQGFVPWDDEMDIGMPREDYEKFIKVIIPEIEKNEELKNRIKLQIAWPSLRGVKSLCAFPSPGIQFVDKKPLANVDIHVLDYYDINPITAKPLFENNLFFRKIRNELGNKIQTCPKDNVEGIFIKYAKAAGITYEKSEFMGYSIDLDFRTPTSVKDIYPLKKVTFEGFEFNSPNNPINYLSNAYYTGDLMKLPEVIHHHDRVKTVEMQFNNQNVTNELEKSLAFWRYINTTL